MVGRHELADPLFVGLVPVLLDSGALGEHGHDLGVGLAFAKRGDGGLVEHDPRAAVDDVPVLPVGRGGQHDIRILGRPGPPGVHRHDEVHARDDAVHDAVGVRAHVDEVGVCEPHELEGHGVGLLGGAVENRGRERVGLVARVRPAVEVEDGTRVVGNRARGGRTASVACATAGHADVAGDHGERCHGAEGGVGVIDALHALAHADAGGLSVCVLLCQARDGVGVDAADLGGVLRRVGGNGVYEVVVGGAAGHAVDLEGTRKCGGHSAGLDVSRGRSSDGGVGGLVPHEVVAFGVAQVLLGVLVDEVRCAALRDELVGCLAVVGDDPVHHAQGQRGVGLRVDGNPLIGHGGCGALARVDDDDLAAGLLGGHVVAQLGGVGVGDVAAPHDEQLRVEVVTRVVRAAAGAEAHGHAHGGAAVAHDAFDVPRRGADAGGIARGSLPAHLAQVARERVERGLRGVLGDDGVELLGDEVHGLVPANALKLARTALADALHGPHDAGLFVLDALNVAH